MKTIQQIVDEQVKKWELSRSETKEEIKLNVVTISREPGSGGQVIAEKLANTLGYDLFHQNVVHKMAESAQISSKLMETLDEKGINILDEWFIGFGKNLWPDTYMKQLLKVIGTIARHGKAVIVGRGANFIIPLESCYRIRIVAPFKTRVNNVARDFNVSYQDAERRVMKTDSERRAFIRRYFYSDIANLDNYDMVINTVKLSIDNAVHTIYSSLQKHQKEHAY